MTDIEKMVYQLVVGDEIELWNITEEDKETAVEKYFKLKESFLKSFFEISMAAQINEALKQGRYKWNTDTSELRVLINFPVDPSYEWNKVVDFNIDHLTLDYWDVRSREELAMAYHYNETRFTIYGMIGAIKDYIELQKGAFGDLEAIFKDLYLLFSDERFIGVQLNCRILVSEQLVKDRLRSSKS